MAKPTYIYRLTHYQNLPFILKNGLHCAHSPIQDPEFVQIGFVTLISQRMDWPVPLEPKGTLGDYIPFYFTNKPPMLYVIYKGNDPECVGNQEEIVYLVSSVERLEEQDVPYVFTDRHAKLAYAGYYNRLQDLSKLDWDIVKSEQWGRQYGTERREIKQAECLVHRHMHVSALMGIACKSEEISKKVDEMLKKVAENVPVKVYPKWYF